MRFSLTIGKNAYGQETIGIGKHKEFHDNSIAVHSLTLTGLCTTIQFKLNLFLGETNLENYRVQKYSKKPNKRGHPPYDAL